MSRGCCILISQGEDRGTLYSGPSQSLPHVLFFWLVLICNLYNKTVITVLLYKYNKVLLYKSRAFQSSVSHCSKLWNLRGSWELLNLQPIGQKSRCPRDSWTCSWHLKWTVSLGTLPLTYAVCTNSGSLVSELNCSIVLHELALSICALCVWSRWACRRLDIFDAETTIWKRKNSFQLRILLWTMG